VDARGATSDVLMPPSDTRASAFRSKVEPRQSRIAVGPGVIAGKSQGEIQADAAGFSWIIDERQRSVRWCQK
jgi:hypothetical protein